MMKKKIARRLQSSSSSLTWSELPDEIILLIMNRLHFVDQIRLRSVCKCWRRRGEANVQGARPADKLPWLMAVEDYSCYMYDPFHRRKYTIENTTLNFRQGRVLACRHGWILFTQTVGTFPLFFFYNPFINKSIQLPRLSKKDMFPEATFTNSPFSSSSNCEIFVERFVDGKTFSMRMCTLGDTEWIEYSFNIEAYYDEPTLRERESESESDDDDIKYDDLNDIYSFCHGMEYVQGVVYCCVTFKWSLTMVVAFNVGEKTWEAFPHPVRETNYILYHNFVEDDDGNLLLGCYNCKLDEEIVFKLDRSRMEEEEEGYWIKLQSFNNRTLFLGRSSLCINPTTEHAGAAAAATAPPSPAAELRNTIHRLPHCYSDCPLISTIYDLHYFHLYFKRFWILPPQNN